MWLGSGWRGRRSIRPVWVACGGVSTGVGEDVERKKTGRRILTGSLGSVFCIWRRGIGLFQEEELGVAGRMGRG